MANILVETKSGDKFRIVQKGLNGPWILVLSATCRILCDTGTEALRRLGGVCSTEWTPKSFEKFLVISEGRDVWSGRKVDRLLAI